MVGQERELRRGCLPEEKAKCTSVAEVLRLTTILTKVSQAQSNLQSAADTHSCKTVANMRHGDTKSRPVWGLGKAFNPYAIPSYTYAVLREFVLYYKTHFQQENSLSLSLYLFIYWQEFSHVWWALKTCVKDKKMWVQRELSGLKWAALAEICAHSKGILQRNRAEGLFLLYQSIKWHFSGHCCCAAFCKETRSEIEMTQLRKVTCRSLHTVNRFRAGIMPD